jgi:plasmid stability protein
LSQVSATPPACNACIISQLTIRDIDDGLKRALRVRAAENGRSMEEEVRQILRTALGMPSPEDEHLKQLLELEARNRR